MANNLLKAFTIVSIRKKILFTLGVIFFYRILAHVPIPGVNQDVLKQMFSGSGVLGFVDLFSGGALSNLSIVASGLGPYISASIIIQVLVMIVPSLEQLSKEGSAGMSKINRYIQLLTIPVALIQSYGLYLLLSKNGAEGLRLFTDYSLVSIFTTVILLTAGTFILMFLSQMITEHGIGQGTSILIFAGIVAGLPQILSNYYSLFDFSQLFNFAMYLTIAFVVIVLVVLVTQATRRIEVNYPSISKSGQSFNGGRSYLPIKINQAGVIPIIFAVSLTMVPSFIAPYLQQSTNVNISEVGYFLSLNFTNGSAYYETLYFGLIFAFTYFYTSIAFNAEKISEDIRKNGGFIPGIRPGSSTVNYLKYVINRLTFSGALFLGLIAVLPSLVQYMTGLSSIAIGGTGLLIVVSVVLETLKQIDSQFISSEYSNINL